MDEIEWTFYANQGKRYYGFDGTMRHVEMPENIPTFKYFNAAAYMEMNEEEKQESLKKAQMAMNEGEKLVKQGKVQEAQKAFQQAMTADGKYGKWIRSHNVVIKINDILFLHGGISPRYAAMSLQTINQNITASLGRKVKKKKRRERPEFYRGLAKGDEGTVKAELEAVINNFGIRHIVIGHTRTHSHVIELKADGAVIMIDVGMSKTMDNGPAMSLLIENGKFYAVTPEEKKELPVKYNVYVNDILQLFRLPHIRFALVGS